MRSPLRWTVLVAALALVVGTALPAAAEANVASLLDALRARGGPFATELGGNRAVRVAVNHEIATPRSPLRNGDEVALFPPVTGG